MSPRDVMREALGVECAWPNPYCPVALPARPARPRVRLTVVHARPEAGTASPPNRGSERATRG